MAFRSLSDYNDKKYGGLFILRNDGDSADVIFLYQSSADVLVADAHYIKSDLGRYVHCCGAGCPACAKGIRTQTKLFIPVYNITAQEIQIWDRNISFETQLQRDIFASYPNPSDGIIFTVTRHGEPKSIDTTYEIRATGHSNELSFEKICNTYNIKFPDYYENIIREVSPSELNAMLNAKPADAPASLPNYKITPRGIAPANSPVSNPAPAEMPTITTDNDEEEDDISEDSTPF